MQSVRRGMTTTTRSKKHLERIQMVIDNNGLKVFSLLCHPDISAVRQLSLLPSTDFLYRNAFGDNPLQAAVFLLNFERFQAILTATQNDPVTSDALLLSMNVDGLNVIQMIMLMKSSFVFDDGKVSSLKPLQRAFLVAIIDHILARPEYFQHQQKTEVQRNPLPYLLYSGDGDKSHAPLSILLYLKSKLDDDQPKWKEQIDDTLLSIIQRQDVTVHSSRWYVPPEIMLIKWKEEQEPEAQQQQQQQQQQQRKLNLNFQKRDNGLIQKMQDLEQAASLEQKSSAWFQKKVVVVVAINELMSIDQVYESALDLYSMSITGIPHTFRELPSWKAVVEVKPPVVKSVTEKEQLRATKEAFLENILQTNQKAMVVAQKTVPKLETLLASKNNNGSFIGGQAAPVRIEAKQIKELEDASGELEKAYFDCGEDFLATSCKPIIRTNDDGGKEKKEEEEEEIYSTPESSVAVMSRNGLKPSELQEANDVDIMYGMRLLEQCTQHYGVYFQYENKPNNLTDVRPDNARNEEYAMSIYVVKNDNGKKVAALVISQYVAVSMGKSDDTNSKAYQTLAIINATLNGLWLRSNIALLYDDDGNWDADAKIPVGGKNEPLVPTVFEMLALMKSFLDSKDRKLDYSDVQQSKPIVDLTKPVDTPSIVTFSRSPPITSQPIVVKTKRIAAPTGTDFVSAVGSLVSAAGSTLSSVITPLLSQQTGYDVKPKQVFLGNDEILKPVTPFLFSQSKTVQNALMIEDVPPQLPETPPQDLSIEVNYDLKASIALEAFRKEVISNKYNRFLKNKNKKTAYDEIQNIINLGYDTKNLKSEYNAIIGILRERFPSETYVDIN